MKIGIIIFVKNKYVKIIFPYYIFHKKYKKLQIKFYKFNFYDIREEFKKGDIVLMNNNKIHKILN